MNFQQQKTKQLSKKDKSNIGEWDSKIADLCNKINMKKEYYTTSSCAGRVVLIKESLKKIKNVFLFRMHEKISFNELKKALNGIKYNGLVEFQQTSCILHVACLNLESAERLLRKARESGWKRSGIISINKGKDSRVMIELLSTESLSFPIMNNKKLLVNDDFLKLVIREANEKLERTWKKIERLKNLI